LVRNLYRAGALAVAFDMTFGDEVPEEDSVFRRAIDETGIVVLGAKSDLFHSAGTATLEEPGGALRGTAIGMVDLRPDAVDAVIREYPIVSDFSQTVGDTSRDQPLRVPQLGMRAVMRYLNLPPDALIGDRDGWSLDRRSPESASVPPVFIPTGGNGGMLINFRGTVRTYSYSWVVDDGEIDLGVAERNRFEALLEGEVFKNRIVVVGSTIPEHQDFHFTAFRALPTGRVELTPGAVIHAQAIQTILSGNHLDRIPRALQYAWTALLGSIVVAAVVRFRLFAGAAVAGVLGGLAWFGSLWMFARYELWLWSVAPILCVVLAYLGAARMRVLRRHDAGLHL
jgi:CHASE2 domain-containing sensor protein